MTDAWSYLSFLKQYEPFERQNVLQAALDELVILKQQVEADQCLARLYYLPCFINNTEQPNSMAAVVCQRFEELMGYALEYYPKIVPAIVRSSAVSEWPCTLKTKTSNTKESPTYDRAPLVLIKDKDRQDSDDTTADQQSTARATKRREVPYRIRFLALTNRYARLDLVHSLTARFHVVRVEGIYSRDRQTFVLEDTMTEKTNVFLVNGTLSEKSRKRARDWEKFHRSEPPLPGSMAKKGIESKGVQVTYDTSAPIGPNFSIGFLDVGIGGKVPGGKNKYSIVAQVEIVLKINTNFVHCGDLQVFSQPLEITTNNSQHDTKHFFPFAWEILRSALQWKYRLQGLIAPNEQVPKGRTWQELKPWIQGLIAAKNIYFCRPLDNSEIRHIRRMLLLRRIMETIQGDDTLTAKTEQFQQEVYGKLLGAKNMKELLDKTRTEEPSENFRFEYADFDSKGYFVDRDQARTWPVSFSPIQWLLNVAKIIADEQLNVHSQENKTTEIFNRKYLSVRSAYSGFLMVRYSSRKILEQQKKGEVDGSKRAEHALVLRIDDYELNTLCIDFTDEKGEGLSGRISVEELRARKYIVKGMRNRMHEFDEKRRDEFFVSGLPAYLKHHHPSNYKKIIQVSRDENTSGVKNLIEKLYPTVEVEEYMKGEIHPTVGPIPKRCPIENMADEIMSQSFSTMEVSRQRSQQSMATNSSTNANHLQARQAPQRNQPSTTIGATNGACTYANDCRLQQVTQANTVQATVAPLINIDAPGDLNNSFLPPQCQAPAPPQLSPQTAHNFTGSPREGYATDYPHTATFPQDTVPSYQSNHSPAGYENFAYMNETYPVPSQPQYQNMMYDSSPQDMNGPLMYPQSNASSSSTFHNSPNYQNGECLAGTSPYQYAPEYMNYEMVPHMVQNNQQDIHTNPIQMSRSVSNPSESESGVEPPQARLPPLALPPQVHNPYQC